MVYALRGALGNELFGRDLPAPDRASAWQALFSTNHLQLAKRQVPSPLLLDVEVDEETINITARLFGFADMWRDVFMAALITALNKGVSIGENSVERQPWLVQDFYYETLCGLPPPPESNFLRLRPQGALCYGAEQHHSAEPARLLLSALSRVTLMARWHRVLLNFNIPTLAEIMAKSSVVKGFQGPITHIEKHSRRHAGQKMLLSGEGSELVLRTEQQDWVGLLQIASACAAGGHTSYGFGRFEIIAA